MAFSKRPIYYFDNKDSLGIDEIPIGRLLIVCDCDSALYFKENNIGLSRFSTIQNAIDSHNIIKYYYSKEEIDRLLDPTLIASGNNIDFATGTNFKIFATIADLTVANSTNLVGQSGNIIIENTENIINLDPKFISTYNPDDALGTEVLEYFIESETKIHIGRKFPPNFGI